MRKVLITSILVLTFLFVISCSSEKIDYSQVEQDYAYDEKINPSLEREQHQENQRKPTPRYNDEYPPLDDDYLDENYEDDFKDDFNEDFNDFDESFDEDLGKDFDDNFKDDFGEDFNDDFSDDMDFKQIGSDTPQNQDYAILVIYKINPDGTITEDKDHLMMQFAEEIKDPTIKGYQDNKQLHKEIWDHFSKLFPTGTLAKKYITEYKAMYYADRTGASISFSNNDMTEWNMEVNVRNGTPFSDGKKLTNKTVLNHMLVHEFGHVLTLNPTQIDVINDEDMSDDAIQKYIDDCKPRYFTVPEGCLKQDSYLNQFVSRFWTKELLNENLELQDKVESMMGESGQLGDWRSIVFDFHKKHDDKFVSAYATMKPAEDIAEAWAFFILKDKPTGNQLKDQKVLFFYEYPELVEIRETARKNI